MSCRLDRLQMNMALCCYDGAFPSPLMEILPEGHNHHLCRIVSEENGFSATLRLDVSTEEDAKAWKKEFEASSLTTWRVKRTRPSLSRYVLFNVEYRCQHGKQRQTMQARTTHKKDTGCVSSLSITVRRTATSRGRMSRSTDQHMPALPTVINLNWHHNHAIKAASALKYKDVSEETCGKLADLYQHGHSPSSALNMLDIDLQMDDPESYLTKCGDRSIFPDLQFCYRLYYKIFNQQYGATDGTDMIASIDQKIIVDYNKQMGSTCAKMERSSNDELIIAICTPLMQRVHSQLRQSSELVFIDSTGNVDRHGSRVFLLLTHSCAGGLPIGVLITSNEQEQTITEALQLWKTLLPQDCFGGKGEQGPAVFITDDCLPERKALHAAFPNATLLLCTFHILQAVWRWLWNANHSIMKDHRQSLYSHVKKMIYAPSTSAVQEAFNSALADPLVVRYPKYTEYLTSLFERREVWALAFRVNLLVRGNNTNNYAEAAMRVLKDSILQRAKAFNVPQLVDFVLSRFESFYQRKLLAVANQRSLKLMTRKPQKHSISRDDITKTGENTYIVNSQSDRSVSYSIDMAVGICTCPQGCTGGPCKHQEAIINMFHIPSVNYPPASTQERTLFLKIATGSTDNIPSRWLESLHSSEPAVDLARPLPAPTTAQPVGDHHVHIAGDDEGDHVTAILQDPQLVRINSLTQQRDIHNQFDKHLHGPSRSQSAESSSLADDLSQMCEVFKEKLSSNPELFEDPVKAMLTSYKKIKSDSSLMSAMRMFGRYAGVSFARRKLANKKGSSALPFPSSSTGSIGVQPTAVSRRKQQLGGRKRLSSGRPTKQARVVEHGYARGLEPTGSRLPKRKRVSAPHCLGRVVAMGQSLGKTHSAK